MACLRYSAEWLARHRRRYVIGTAIIVTLSYLTVLLPCAYRDGKYLDLSVLQNVAYASVTSETPGRDSDEEHCQYMHQQMIALEAFSSASILVAKMSYTGLVINEEIPRQASILNGFRPPPACFVPARELRFQLYSVLRI